MRRPSPTYANVVATLALVLALGGTSYAAAGLITGQDIKDGTVTGADVKKHSVPVSRLQGKLPKGPRGPQGPQGPQGPVGEVQVVAPPEAWSDPNDATLFSRFADQITYYRESGGTAADFLARNATSLPVTVGGKALRWTGVDLCFSRNARGTLVDVTLEQRRQPALGSETTVASKVVPGPDPSTTFAGCTRFALDAPSTVLPTDLVRVTAHMAFTNSSGVATVNLGRVTYLFTAAS